VKTAVTPRTRAIIPVHLYGLPADMPELVRLAEQRRIYLIEDAAQAHGAEIEGRRVGTWGHIACFSFYPGKNLGAYGDAGAVVTNDKSMADKIRLLSNHGRTSKYDHEIEGTNSRLDGMQAAILNVKLKHLDEWVGRRRNVAGVYAELLGGGGIVLPTERTGFRHVYHLYVVRVPDRDRVMEFLDRKGIATGIHYPVVLPLSKPYSRLGYKPGDFPAAERCAGEILSLPMFPELTMEQVTYICEALKEAVSL
jgi:dTDP-4-amino-4,6-dideoxygalactose transaminase